MPIVDIDGWSLKIDGMVDKELELTFDDLLAMPLIERDITLTCVSNSVGGPYVGGARWLGVRLTDLLDMAGVQDGVDQIFSTDVDGMTIGTPYDLATDGRDAMIAIGMNGEAAPARARLPGPDGRPRPLRLHQRLQVDRADHADDLRRRATRTGPSATGPPTPRSRSPAGSTPPRCSRPSTPATPSSAASPGRSRTAAWRGVQVQIDGGGWQDAMLGP